MQIAVIEYARNVAGLAGANSAEFDEYAPHKVIDLMPEQLEVEGMGGTMRLGDWPMQLNAGTKIAELYGVPQGGTVKERHRHRFEVNPAYVGELKQAGLNISGVTPGVEGRGAGLVESIEIPGHPYFVALQAHPEFKSRPMRPSPPFAGFVKAALEHQQG
jgi:CTP synthase